MQNVIQQIKQYVSSGVCVNMALDTDQELLGLLKNEFVWWQSSDSYFFGTQEMKKEWQIQQRRKAVFNMFDNPNPKPNENGIYSLNDFLDPVVAATPIDE